MLVRPVGPAHSRPWNKGLLVGQKKPLQPKHVWSIRVRLEIARTWGDLALSNLAIDSKLRACDLVKLRIDEVCSGAKTRDRATVVQKKTGDRCNSRLRSRRGPPLKLGCERSERLALDISSRANFMHALTYPPDNMPGWCIAGLIASVWKQSPMVPIRCGGRRSLRSIARLATFVLSSSSLAIQNWRAPSVISGLR
jgi:hypothetical protein